MDCENKSESVLEVKRAGTALLKPEYIITNQERSLAVESLSDEDKEKLTMNGDDKNEQPVAKKGKFCRKEKKKKGQNKSRGPTFVQDREALLCSHLLEGNNNCPLEKCIYMHDTKEYLAKKPPDISSVCPIYSVRGFCPRGITCRFGSQHINDDQKSVTDKTVQDIWTQSKHLQTSNSLSKDIQIDLRKRKYDFSKSDSMVKYIDKLKSKNKLDVNKDVTDKPLGIVDDSDLIRLRSCEKKKIDWKDKLYLSPLTTVGNLPFRRICKEFGVDITCGEMAMASSILQGNNQEWALTKRHGSEDLFGVQVCGNNPSLMARCAQVLQDQVNIDFIDVNLGCPIDLVYQQGSGSGLLRRENVLMTVLKVMNCVLDIPLTLKTRTGVYSDKNIAHSLIPKFREAGVSLITVHGRSREQRYTRSADWDYIEQCAQLAAPTPLFGNGDILSYNDYVEVKEKYPSVAGVMIGRGALIKPWIFTEIKEQRLWDISSQERFEILKKYVNYGLEHWGTDTKGVENTRRFLLEWLSFLYRYVPVGILLRPPQKINERPPYYHGRDELETLMASPNCADWVKISEMLLGPVPDGFNFLPKHKANSWS